MKPKTTNPYGHMIKVDPHDLAEKVKGLMEERNVTTAEVYEGRNISEAWLNGVLNEKHDTLGSLKVKTLAEALGVNYGWLIGKANIPKYALTIQELPSNNLFTKCETPERPAITQQLPGNYPASTEEPKQDLEEAPKKISAKYLIDQFNEINNKLEEIMELVKKGGTTNNYYLGGGGDNGNIQ